MCVRMQIAVDWTQFFGVPGLQPNLIAFCVVLCVALFAFFRIILFLFGSLVVPLLPRRHLCPLLCPCPAHPDVSLSIFNVLHGVCLCPACLTHCAPCVPRLSDVSSSCALFVPTGCLRLRCIHVLLLRPCVCLSPHPRGIQCVPLIYVPVCAHCSLLRTPCCHPLASVPKEKQRRQLELDEERHMEQIRMASQRRAEIFNLAAMGVDPGSACQSPVGLPGELSPLSPPLNPGGSVQLGAQATSVPAEQAPQKETADEQYGYGGYGRGFGVPQAPGYAAPGQVVPNYGGPGQLPGYGAPPGQYRSHQPPGYGQNPLHAFGGYGPGGGAPAPAPLYGQYGGASGSYSHSARMDAPQYMGMGGNSMWQQQQQRQQQQQHQQQQAVLQDVSDDDEKESQRRQWYVSVCARQGWI